MCEYKIYFHACREPKNLYPLPFLRKLPQIYSRKMRKEMKRKENMEPRKERTQKENDGYTASLKNEHFRIFLYTFNSLENHVHILIGLMKHLRKKNSE